MKKHWLLNPYGKKRKKKKEKKGDFLISQEFSQYRERMQVSLE
jgi:hypothetical protein